MKKKVFLVLAMVVILAGGGIYFFLTGESRVEKLAGEQLELIRETVGAVEDFEKSGNADGAITKLEALEPRYSGWSKRQDELADAGEKAPTEVLAEIEQLRGELTNALIQLEISEHEEAPKVLKVLERITSSSSE